MESPGPSRRALFRGELDPPWRELLRSTECENQSGEAEIPDGVLDEAAEEFLASRRDRRT